jgi:hypothetical protein
MAVAAAAVLGAVLPSCRSSGPTPPGSGCASPTAHTGVTKPVVAPGGPGLRVVEQGLRTVGTFPKRLSLGGVVENASTLVAYRARVRFDALDAHQDSAVAPTSRQLLYQEIPVIMPGQKIGVGAWSYPANAPNGGQVTAVSVRIEVTAGEWWPVHNDVHPFTAVTARDERLRRDATDASAGSVSYTADSPYCGTVSGRGVAVVYRDGSGAVVGGSFEPPRPDALCGPGRVARTTTAAVVPADADDARTTVSPYCDPSPPDRNPGASGTPAN